MLLTHPPGLVDLIAGMAPTLSGWTNDPTDTLDLTDGDMSTWCSTGDKVQTAGYQYGYMEWDLGGVFHVAVGGLGRCDKTAGNGFIYVEFWDGSLWRSGSSFTSSGTQYAWSSRCAMCSKVRLCFTSSVAATISPNVREFSVWRM